MNQYLHIDPWRIVEQGFNPQYQKHSESIFSLGNGYMGQRANFEEGYSGQTLQGTYIGGIYYTDKTRVGWWKNGYPEYFAKVLNAPSWNGVKITIEGEKIDLAACEVQDFERILDMRQGVLERKMILQLSQGRKVGWHSRRFLSMTVQEAACIEIALTPLNFSGKIEIEAGVDGGVKNEDANYGEMFWDIVDCAADAEMAMLTARTRKTDFTICCATSLRCWKMQEHEGDDVIEPIVADNRAFQKMVVDLHEHETLHIEKYVVLYHSMNHAEEALPILTSSMLTRLRTMGWEALLKKHVERWAEIWQHADIAIEGDDASQQAIRFTIFQLNQTYRGEDSRLNIGPKGFTGEKYGGSTYWDTEAYCLPFFLATASPTVAKNLLLYRYKQLDKAIENGSKLGFRDGAALYPMVTMNGEECHNEWEITFEEVHRNGAIAFAINRYILYTGDHSYLKQGGLEVLIGICRFWSQRFTFSKERKKYVMLGVTGPNEYENNVNNNWYTNKIALWCLDYTTKKIHEVMNQDPIYWAELVEKTNFSVQQETEHWHQILLNTHLPEDDGRGIFLQQDGYLDKEQILARDLPNEIRPLNQHWSWDRILRSCFIKQADVLQGVYFFEPTFDTGVIERNFDFYEPRTVHESSLSPCIHAILAAKLNRMDKAYELFLRTARLDLDDYNHEVHEGLHITSMAGTWMSVVEGFGGMRVNEDGLWLRPKLPSNWTGYSFNIFYRDCIIHVQMKKGEVELRLLQGEQVDLHLNKQKITLHTGKVHKEKC